MLRLIPFNFFINTLGNNTERTLNKSGGDINLADRLAGTPEDTAAVQSNPDKLDKCADRSTRNLGLDVRQGKTKQKKNLHYEHGETLEQIACRDQK